MFTRHPDMPIAIFSGLLNNILTAVALPPTDGHISASHSPGKRSSVLTLTFKRYSVNVLALKRYLSLR